MISYKLHNFTLVSIFIVLYHDWTLGSHVVLEHILYLLDYRVNRFNLRFVQTTKKLLLIFSLVVLVYYPLLEIRIDEKCEKYSNLVIVIEVINSILFIIIKLASKKRTWFQAAFLTSTPIWLIDCCGIK